MSAVPPMNPPRLVQDDPWLAPYAPAIVARLERFRAKLGALGGVAGLRGAASSWHLHYGLNPGERQGQPGLWCREWLPGAVLVSLTGDFNGWNRHSHPLSRGANGIWELFLPADAPAPRHGEKYKLHIVSARGTEDRVPATCRRLVQDADGVGFTPVHWQPPSLFVWRYPRPAVCPAHAQAGRRIYEAHVGMALEEGRVGTFGEFTARMLPRIAAAGYDTVQLMAVQEHPYYASFGYQVANFYAVSSRFGTPDDFKALVDAAHGLGLSVIMDLVHSHAAPNVAEGLPELDGTDHQWFHAGPRGHHSAWGSRCFDYGKPEVVGFLLSNVHYWLGEFNLDGFRYDGITSMLYHDHGLGRAFGDYGDYFGANVDEDALLYLQLATTLAEAVRPGAIQLAEDVSGLPGIARPVHEGGVGFSGRLDMGLPDYWIRRMKEVEAGLRDEEWNLGEMWHTLTNRRTNESHVGYVESHDQALVGDKTLLMWLLGAHIYSGMSILAADPVVDRGVALHKMIRAVTFGLSGGGWLNFMGNEFGHPEWVDFPRAGNGWSFAHCRRQWSLADDPLLRFAGLQAFDRALMALDVAHGVLNAPPAEQLWLDAARKILVFRRGTLVFAFNWHPTDSQPDLPLPVPAAADYRVLLSSDAAAYAGHGRVAESARFPWLQQPVGGQSQSIKVYLPCRTVMVLGLVE